jgi:hypothetical protein
MMIDDEESGETYGRIWRLRVFRSDYFYKCIMKHYSMAISNFVLLVYDMGYNYAGLQFLVC